MPARGKKKPVSVPSKLRIIGGQWRGRWLNFVEAEGLRPTGNRIRETLFNWLMPVLPGSVCLDAFAGSGALGFEALSRGAASCQFCETDPQAQQFLRSNQQSLGAASVDVFPGSVLNYLNQPVRQLFDVVFLDPPFTAQLWQPTVELLEQGWLADSAWIYVETPTTSAQLLPSHWQCHRQKTAGAVNYSLYLREQPR